MESTSAPSLPETESGWLRLSKLSFRHARGQPEALRELSLATSVHAVAVVGPNGCGKSTLLSILAGRRRATAGHAGLWEQPAHARKLSSRRGFAGQRAELDTEMTVREHLVWWAALERVQPAGWHAWMERFGLGDRADQRVADLSGGLRRRLHLALSLLAGPELWLADEPEAGLDGAGRAMLAGLIRERTCAGQRTLWAAHDLESVADLADEVWGLEQGRLTLRLLRSQVNDADGLRDRLGQWQAAQRHPQREGGLRGQGRRR